MGFINNARARYINEVFKYPSNKLPSLEDKILAGNFKP